MPRGAFVRSCTSCGLEHHFTDRAPPSAQSKCDDCGAILTPERTPDDPLQLAKPSELEAGAAEIRTFVQEMKRRRQE